MWDFNLVTKRINSLYNRIYKLSGKVSDEKRADKIIDRLYLQIEDLASKSGFFK